MIRVDKMDVFAMVVEALERDDPQTASALMQIISKSIKKEKKFNVYIIHLSFSLYFLIISLPP